MINKYCFYCKKISDIYLRSKNKNISNNSINFASTELYVNKFEIKPNLFYCKDCEIIFSEYCDNSFQENYVDVLDPLYVDQIENKKKYFNNLINKISDQFESSDNVLEIGSYYGAFGSQIVKKVKSYTGIELSPHACEYAKRNFNLNIRNENIYEFFKQNRLKFDVIFMFDVIEHLDDPDLVLKLCANNLNSKGRLIISTMNMDSLFAKITGRYYQWIIPMHKFYFSNYSIKKFLNRNNLEIDRIINDVRIISLEYFFLKLSQKILLFKYFYKLLINFKSIKNLTIKFSLFDINIYCSYLKKKTSNETH
jgi:2-polyprenyl-3-methyl-5-hydroxy-6-metoxy-1,4-benzoquinol methylase